MEECPIPVINLTAEIRVVDVHLRCTSVRVQLKAGATDRCESDGLGRTTTYGGAGPHTSEIPHPTGLQLRGMYALVVKCTH